MALFVAPAVLIALWMLAGVWRDAGRLRAAGARVMRRLARPRRGRGRAAPPRSRMPASRANFASSSVTHASVAMDQTSRYLQLLSDAADTTTLTGYADKRNASPLVRAATGADDALAVALGGYKNTNNTRDPARVHRPGAQPAAGRRRLDHRHRDAAARPRAASSRSPASTSARSPGTGSSTSVTLAPGDKRWLNLSASMKGSAFPGNNLLYHPVVRITVRYAGYAGSFLSYDVPVSIWDGNGSGP